MPKKLSPPPETESDAQIKTRDEAEAAMAIVASLHVQVQQAELAKTAKIIAARITDDDAAISALNLRMFRQRERLEAWAGLERKGWGEAKSLELRHGTIGFKLGNRSVQLLKNWTEELVVVAVLAAGKAFKGLIRNKPSLNKTRVLELSQPVLATDDTLKLGKERLTAAALKELGVEVGRVESFYCDPKLECVSP